MDRVRDWTVLVYMNDNNNLCKGAQAMLKHQLGAIEPCDRVYIAVEYSHIREPHFTHPNGVTHRRAEVGTRALKNVETLPCQDMADTGTIEDFLRWGIRSFPAKKYAVVFQSHGGAWRASMPDEVAGAAKHGVSDEPYGPRPSTTVTVPALADALRRVEAETGVKPEVIAFDSCLMGNTEAAYELADRANVLIASEDVITSTPSEYALDYAVPLQPILQRLSDRLAAGEHPHGEDVARDWVDACARSWTTPTQSAFRLAEMKPLAGALDRLAGSLLDADVGVLREVIGKARHFSDKETPDRFDREYDFKIHLKDLRDLAQQVLADDRLQPSWDAAGEVLKAFDAARAAHEAQRELQVEGRTSYGEAMFSRHEKYDADRTHGLSIWAPDNQKVVDSQKADGNDYDALAFARDTRWPTLIRKIIA